MIMGTLAVGDFIGVWEILLRLTAAREAVLIDGGAVALRQVALVFQCEICHNLTFPQLGRENLLFQALYSKIFFSPTCSVFR